MKSLFFVIGGIYERVNVKWSSWECQKNTMETIDIFISHAYHIRAYRIKSELQALSLQYLYPEKYKKIEDIKL